MSGRLLRGTRRVLFLGTAVFLGLSGAARADTYSPDPVGFCPPPATAATCSTATGIGGESISLGSNPTSFGMIKTGGQVSNDPWYLILAIPNYVGPAPTITSPDFSLGPTQNAGDWLNGSALDLYQFAALTQPGVMDTNASMNSSNLFGANEVAAYGSAPSFFDVFVYTVQPAIIGMNPYTFFVGGGGLLNGTWLAASGGSQPFSTPYTTAGLAHGPNVPPQPAVPEPASLALVGSGLALAASRFRKRQA